MKVGKWKLLLPLGAARSRCDDRAHRVLSPHRRRAAPVRVAIMTDCKGGFGFGYELDIGGAQAAFGQYAGGKPKNRKKPSAGMTGIKAGGKTVNIVGYGCGDDTAATAIKETRRLMQQLKADVMVGPLSGDEAVAIANWAKANPTKTIIVGTAGSQDPTMQIAPKNLFRYFGDGAQWNAGVGELAYKRLGWRNAAIIMDDYAFGWTSAAGMIADFCAVGGKITKRVFPPLNNADYAAFVRQLPRARRRRRLLLGGRRKHAGQPDGVRAGVRQAQPEAVHREPLLRVPGERQGGGSEVRRVLHRRHGHRSRQSTSRRWCSTGRS